MKFSRELLLDAHQGTVLLDVSVLVGMEAEREREGERHCEAVAVGGRGSVQEAGRSLGSVVAPRFPGAPSYFLSDRVNIEPVTFVRLFREPLLLDAITLNGTEQTGAQ